MNYPSGIINYNKILFHYIFLRYWKRYYFPNPEDKDKVFPITFLLDTGAPMSFMLRITILSDLYLGTMKIILLNKLLIMI